MRDERAGNKRVHPSGEGLKRGAGAGGHATPQDARDVFPHTRLGFRRRPSDHRRGEFRIRDTWDGAPQASGGGQRGRGDQADRLDPRRVEPSISHAVSDRRGDERRGLRNERRRTGRAEDECDFFGIMARRRRNQGWRGKRRRRTSGEEKHRGEQPRGESGARVPGRGCGAVSMRLKRIGRIHPRRLDAEKYVSESDPQSDRTLPHPAERARSLMTMAPSDPGGDQRSDQGGRSGCTE